MARKPRGLAKALGDLGEAAAYDHVSRIDAEVAVLLGLLMEGDGDTAA